MAIEARQLFNFIQGSDITGESAYDVWKRLGNEGSEADFLEFIRSGPKGENAHIYALAVSNPVMKKGANNALLPVNTTFTGFYRIGAEPTKYDFAGRFIIEETTNGTEWEAKYTSEADEVSVVYTPSSSDVKIIKCTLYAAGGTTTEIDTQTCVILEDVAGLKVGARNLLSNSDIRYTFTNDSSETIDSISIVNNFDLQRLVNETVTLSFYADTMGGYTNADDGTSETSNKFGIIAKLVWSDSTGAMPDKLIETPLEINGVGVNKSRVSATHDVVAPERYDTIDSFTFDIVLSLKPDNGNTVWVFERPKLEVGNLPTEWTLAPEDVSKLAPPDWNQNDETAKDYIKNKPFYAIENEVVLLEETTAANYDTISESLIFEEGKTYTVNFDGTRYECVAWYNGNAYVIGNGDIYGGEGNGNGEPFSCDSYSDGNCYLNTSDVETHTISITELESDVVKIDEKYLPEGILDWEYLKNKPFNSGNKLLVNETIIVNPDNYDHIEGISLPLIEGETYTVIWDGSSYKCTYREIYDDTFILGNTSMNFDDDDTGEPFLIVKEVYVDAHTGDNGEIVEEITEYIYIHTNDSEETYHTIRIFVPTLNLDQDYLPKGIELSSSEDSENQYTFGVEGDIVANSKSENPISLVETANKVEEHQKRYSQMQFVLTDRINGYDYIVEMQDGNLVSYCACIGIRIDKLPDKTSYVEGEPLDPTGMIVTAICPDGTTKEVTDYILCPNVDDTTVTITYIEAGIEHTATIDVTVQFLKDILVDFEYTVNNDGTYTLTGWKQTLNGEPSTEMFIPDSNKIIVEVEE